MRRKQNPEPEDSSRFLMVFHLPASKRSPKIPKVKHEGPESPSMWAQPQFTVSLVQRLQKEVGSEHRYSDFPSVQKFLQHAAHRPATQGGSTMNSPIIESPNMTKQITTQPRTNKRKMQIATLLAVSAIGFVPLTAGVFASNLPNARTLETRDAKDVLEVPKVSFATQGFASTDKESEQALEVRVPSWSLGPIGFDADGGNLEIVSTTAPDFLKVELTDASGGANQDRLNLKIISDQNTPKGEYPIEVTLTNKKYGDSGTITVIATVE
jgi:hypothetical protein